ncbi:MAG: peptidoglycan binding domain-containing protein, partial [Lachnospiraceae bacterium]|nr:peptidoglycan binding domain-containing protein [Lachnospiraceae bacterium]
MSEAQTAKGSKKKIILITCALIGAILAGGYIFAVHYYSSHFLPGTIVNGIDCQNADMSSVMERLKQYSDDYQLVITGRSIETAEKDQLLTIYGREIGYVNEVEMTGVAGLLESQNPWLWLGAFLDSGNHYTLSGTVTWSEEKLRQILENAQAFQEKTMIAPKDAYLQGYSEVEKKFVLAPETLGTQLNLKKVYEKVGEALSSVQDTIDLEEAECYLSASVTTENAALQRKLQEANKWLGTQIRYDWNGTEVLLNSEQIKDWIYLENGTAKLDKEKVAAFVAENAKAYDTYRKTRTFHTTRGYDLELPGGAFGWLTDRDAETEELLELIEKGSVCDREPIYQSKAPVKGMDDIGSSYVEADMTFQHLYLYQKGEIVLETDFVSGNMSNGNKTPQGVFGLTYKTRNATLRGANYASFVHYWMPFNGNVGMHDATWRSVFGGDIYKTSGSHGCINLPLSKAAEIYPYMSQGFPIICYYYPDGVLSEEDMTILAASSATTVGVVEQEGTNEGSVTVWENNDDDDDDD